jgi:hypothetical protein
MIIEEKFARLRTYAIILTAIIGCLRRSFQPLSANLLKGA